MKLRGETPNYAIERYYNSCMLNGGHLLMLSAFPECVFIVVSMSALQSVERSHVWLSAYSVEFAFPPCACICTMFRVLCLHVCFVFQFPWVETPVTHLRSVSISRVTVRALHREKGDITLLICSTPFSLGGITSSLYPECVSWHLIPINYSIRLCIIVHLIKPALRSKIWSFHFPWQSNPNKWIPPTFTTLRESCFFVLFFFTGSTPAPHTSANCVYILYCFIMPKWLPHRR